MNFKMKNVNALIRNYKFIKFYRTQNLNQKGGISSFV